MPEKIKYQILFHLGNCSSVRFYLKTLSEKYSLQAKIQNDAKFEIGILTISWT